MRRLPLNRCGLHHSSDGITDESMIAPTNHNDRRVEVRVLGALSIRRNASECHSLLAQHKCVALLAHLILAPPGCFLRRDALVALLWPERDDERARSSLRTALHRVRLALGESVIVTHGTEEVAIEHSVIWCDALEFEEVIRTRSEHALALYRGDLLDGFFVSEASAAFEQWLETERTRFRALAGAAAWRRADELSQVAQLEPAATAAARAAELAPADEPAARQVMRQLAAHGHRGAVMDLYRDIERRLHSAYDMTPSAETRELVERLRVGISPPGPAAQVAPDRAAQNLTTLPPKTARTIGAALLATTALVWTAFHGVTHGPSEAAAGSGATAVRVHPWKGAGSIAPPRTLAAMVLDARRDQAIVIGGTSAGLLLNDVWRLEGLDGGSAASATLLQPHGEAPAPRWGHAAAYDSLTDRVIVFGGALGHSAPCANDVWLLENASGRRGRPHWRRLSTAGTVPAPRANHSAVYDAATSRLIVFGGHDCFTVRFNDVWILTRANGVGGPATWVNASIDTSRPSPPARSNHQAVLNAALDRLIVFGGVDADGGALDDAWTLTASHSSANRHAWQKVVTSERPPPTYCHASGYAADEDVLIVFGGNTGGHASGDVWLLEHGASLRSPRWRRSNLPVSPGLARACHAGVYNERRDQFFVIGGESGPALITDAWVIDGPVRRKP